MPIVSVIIPARNEIYLQKTIENILANTEGDIEVIAILDGYWSNPPIKDDPRVLLIHHTNAIGQRQSINEGARIARGKYVLKCDAHCAFDKGFDVKLAADCEYDWTIIPRMYNLDHNTWLPKMHKRTDYMYISNAPGKELRALYYNKRHSHSDSLIDDVMTGQGACFFMQKDRFWELEGMDENHGSWGQMGVEVALKAWLSGGSLKVNKKTWFSHWFRGESSGFPYPISGKDVAKARSYSNDLWKNNKWHKQVRTLEWLLNKFNPPDWESKPIDNDIERKYYEYMIGGGRMPKWRGVDVIKYPNDLILYEEALYNNKPDFIVETGTYRGGSSYFLADICELIGHGHVITIDMHNHHPPKHKRITHIIGRSTDSNTLKQVKELVGDGTCMVILDSNHHRSHVKRELHFYSDIATRGQYIVAEDTNYKADGNINGVEEAVTWFVKRNKNYKIENPEKKYIFSLCPNGWIKKQ